jgi:ferrous iron transport protein B
MAARTLRSPRERLATLLTVSFMNCGAKLPVLALLTATFFSKNQAQLMFLLTLLAWGVALAAAKFLRLTVLRGESTPFVMELPPYRFPTFRGLFIHTWERTWQYIKKAGTTILAISILIWAMMTFPGLPASEEENFARQRQEILAASAAPAREALEKAEAPLPEEALQLKEKLTALDSDQAGRALRHSLAGRIGTSMETVSWLPGFDWRTNIALVGGFAAKEVIVATLGTAYSLGETDPEDTASLSETLARDPHWNPLMALALIVFVMFYAPCFVTVVCISRESGSWKWGLFAICFNTVLAFSLATLVYQGGRALGFAG